MSGLYKWCCWRCVRDTKVLAQKVFFPLIMSKVAVCEMTSVVVSREIKQCFHTPWQGKLIKSSTGNADAA